MKLPPTPRLKIGLMVALVGLGFSAAFFLSDSPSPVIAQNTTPAAEKAAAQNPGTPASASNTNGTTQAVTNSAAPTTAPSPPATNTPPAHSAQSEPASQPSAPPGSPQPPTVPSAAAIGPVAPGPDAQSGALPERISPTDEIPVSFQGANVDMIVQWLAKRTGKSVVKHPRVQCQLTIVSSKKLPVRDAVNLSYRALALEGFTAIESSKSILIVPEGQEPKLNPELLDGSQTEIPEGRQRLIKVFPLK